MRALFTTLLVLTISTLHVMGQDPQAHVDNGQQLIQNGKYEEALEQFNMAIILDPASKTAFIQRAFTYSVLKDYESAISDYSHVLQLNPALISAYLSRGSAYNKLERFEEALQDFNKVIELDPNNSEAYNNRGWSKKGMGDKDGACADWKTSKKMGNQEAKIILKNNQC